MKTIGYDRRLYILPLDLAMLEEPGKVAAVIVKPGAADKKAVEDAEEMAAAIED